MLCIRKLASFFLIIAALLLLPNIGLAKSNLISETEEIKMGQSAAADAVKKRGLSTDTEVQSRAGAVFEQLLPFVSRKSLPYKIQVTAEKEINAFAYPGGQIFVTEGLMRAIGTDDELAFVIGHELGHSDSYHIVESIERTVWASLFTSLLYQQNDDLAKFVGPALQIGLSRGYGFKNEHEADRLGFIFATRAGYNPAGGAIFFHELQEKYGDGSKSIANFTNPHPKNSVRITNQMKHLTALSGNRVSVTLPDKKAQPAVVQLNEQPALTIQADHGGWSASQRAEWVAGRLARLLHNGVQVTPNNISITPGESGFPEIRVADNELIITVSEADALAADTDTDTLAQQWLANIQNSVN